MNALIEPFARDFGGFTAVALAVVGTLLLVSALLSRTGHRLGIPVNLLFLVIGMLAGSDGPGGIWFDRFDVSYLLGTAALSIILFSGGLNTSLPEFRRVLPEAGLLATIGVIGIAALTAVGGHTLGMGWREALLVGAIVSSTDAAAVFAVLNGVPLRRSVAMTIEAESGLNDPVAVILTLAASANLTGVEPLGWHVLPEMLVQLLVGGACGAAIGVGSRWMLRRVRPSTPALFPVITLAIALLAFSAPAILGGSGFLAVYVAGIAIGNGAIPYQHNLARFHDSLAWLAQIAMFLILGLLVFPSQLLRVAVPGVLLAVYLAVIARPVVVTVCLLPFGYSWREIACVAWLGLRGAVPIILATVPVLLSEVPMRTDHPMLDEFNLVFFIVVIGSIIPGMTVRWVPRLLGLEERVAPEPAAVVDITSSLPLRDMQLTFFIAPDSPVVGQTVQDLALPGDAALMLIVRRDELIAPRGHTALHAGDHAFVFCHEGSATAVRERFGDRGYV